MCEYKNMKEVLDDYGRHVDVVRYILFRAFTEYEVDVSKLDECKEYWISKGDAHLKLLHKWRCIVWEDYKEDELIVIHDWDNPDVFEAYAVIHTELIDSMFEGGKKGFRDKYKELSGW